MLYFFIWVLIYEIWPEVAEERKTNNGGEEKSEMDLAPEISVYFKGYSSHAVQYEHPGTIEPFNFPSVIFFELSKFPFLITQI